MSSALTAHTAEVTTATVEIRTLTISGKQVTLAVFRQVQREALRSGGRLRGQPWGWVNYHPDNCRPGAGEKPHRHVLWQLGSELRRARVESPATARSLDEYLTLAALWTELPQLFIAI